MKFAVVVFPGSNGDRDMYRAINDVLGHDVEYVSYEATSLDGFEGILLTGGFSYGDYLRCGAIVKASNVVQALRKIAAEGTPILGVCNGFQVLLEAGLLPGTMMINKGLSFICKTAPLKVQNNDTLFTTDYVLDEEIKIPIAHGEGNYYCDEDTFLRL